MEYLLKASAVIVLMYLCFHLILKKETFFEHNRWFLLTGLLLAIVFPFIVIPVYIPIEPLATQTTTFIPSTPSSFGTIAQPEVVFDWFKLIPILYSIGLSVFLIQFVVQFGSLVFLLLKNPKQKEQRFTYVIVNTKISPFSFFKWIVYNPDSYKEEELQLILAHEKVHVNQLHSIDILLTQLACVVFWFNPLIWLYRKEVRQNLEYIADFKSQNNSNAKKDYQHLLLKTSVANHDTILSNNFYNSSIKKRILMLNKSRSDRKNQWKYVLMLPLLAGLLISMNTETVYIETETLSINSEDSSQFEVSKNTSDAELNAMTKTIANKGGTLVFTKIKRNDANELTNIFLKLNNHSYGGGDSNNTINSFIIYKEWFGDKGGFVGRIEGATLHFENADLIKDAEKTNALQNRAIKAILKRGIQNEDDYKRFQQQHARYNNKANDEQTKPKDSIISQGIMLKFTNQMNDKRLEEFKTLLKSRGVQMKIKRINRNQENKISNLNIEFKSKNNTANYKAKNEHGIRPFNFEMTDKTFGISNLKEEVQIEETIMVYNSEKSTSGDSQNDTLYFKIAKQKTHTNDSIYFSIDSTVVENLSKVKSDHYYEGDKTLKINNISEEIIIHQPQKAYKNITYQSNKNPKPLVIVNGKEVSSDYLKSISAEIIESMTILKGEKAINQYGEKGENGVIELTTKESAIITKKDNPLQITRSELTSITFIDDEDASKNASIAYISKYTTDDVLASHKVNLENIGISVNYSKLKRNKVGDITSIKISLDDGEGSKTSATWKVNDGIPNIEYGKSEGKLITRTKQK
ncbi:M56 family metallopeptidase [Winogradskyella helgolandensis]|uniref:M56 family metallopeptidase n=1 Tax=Winogradskyella helgolandensis TaxID=2697010 RepID=UPI0015BEEFE2|nr:M56 family metallopeptidase [Winogradskyella helgolandensis]